MSLVVLCVRVWCVGLAQLKPEPKPTQHNPTQHVPTTTKKSGKKKKRTLLSAGSLDLGSGANTDETVVRLELLQGLSGVVDESEAGALATTVLGAETEDGDLVLVGLVERRDLVAELILGDVGTVGVEDVTVKESMLVETNPSKSSILQNPIPSPSFKFSSSIFRSPKKTSFS